MGARQLDPQLRRFAPGGTTLSAEVLQPDKSAGEVAVTH